MNTSERAYTLSHLRCLRAGEAMLIQEHTHKLDASSPDAQDIEEQVIGLLARGIHLRPTNAQTSPRLYSTNSHWLNFRSWCQPRGLAALPAETHTVALHLVDFARPEQGGKRRSDITVALRAKGIDRVHSEAGLSCPSDLGQEVRDTLQELRTTPRVRPALIRSLNMNDVLAIVTSLGVAVQDIRDKAILLLSLATGLNPRQLCHLKIDDVVWHPKAITIKVRGSGYETNSASYVIVPEGYDPLLCPVRALETWLATYDENVEPLFCPMMGSKPVSVSLAEESMKQVIRRLVSRANPGTTETFLGGGLRAAFIRDALKNRAPLDPAMTNAGLLTVKRVQEYLAATTRDNADSARAEARRLLACTRYLLQCAQE